MCKAFEWKCVNERERETERLQKKKECDFVYFVVFEKKREHVQRCWKILRSKRKQTHRENK